MKNMACTFYHGLYLLPGLHLAASLYDCIYMLDMLTWQQLTTRYYQTNTDLLNNATTYEFPNFKPYNST